MYNRPAPCRPRMSEYALQVEQGSDPISASREAPRDDEVGFPIFPGE